MSWRNVSVYSYFTARLINLIKWENNLSLIAISIPPALIVFGPYGLHLSKPICSGNLVNSKLSKFIFLPLPCCNLKLTEIIYIKSVRDREEVLLTANFIAHAFRESREVLHSQIIVIKISEMMKISFNHFLKSPLL